MSHPCFVHSLTPFSLLEKVIIDDDEFRSLFEAKKSSSIKKVAQGENSCSVVKVINSKRANNGGIVLARLKMTNDELAKTIDTM